MALDAFSGNALAHAASLDMGQPRGAPMGLVKMEVAVDERRQEEHAAQIEAVASRRRCPWRVGRDDDAAGDLHVSGATLGQARVGQDHQTRFSRFAAAYW